MTALVDTHAHMYLSKFQDDLDEVLSRAKETGIEKIYMPNIDSNTIDSMLQLENDYPDFCVPMIGVHPCYIKDDFEQELSVARSWLEKRDFCALGEIGIDLYWDKTYKSEQISAFELQIEWAKEMDKPIVIHCRESMDLTIEVVHKLQDGHLSGVFHCFTGDAEQARKIVDLGFLLGIGGVATFKNGGLDKVLPHVSLEQIILETDSPYLAPTPYRGKRNEPSFLMNIANQVASMMREDLQTVASVTTSNAKILFEDG